MTAGGGQQQRQRLSEGLADTDSTDTPGSDATADLYEVSMNKLAALAEEFQAAMSTLPPPSGMPSVAVKGHSNKR